MEKKIVSLEAAKKILADLEISQITSKTNWSVYQTFAHCAATIDYSMSGYPQMKPFLLRITVGKLAISKFLKQGFMKHDLTADVAGAPKVKDEGSSEKGRELLLESIDRFLSYDKQLKPHLFFGNLTKEQYNAYFALHIADHLGGMEE